jgi:hypothetical protein
MNYRTATDDQLRKERVRLLNQQRIMQQRRDSAVANRGGRNMGYRSGSTAYGLERELVALNAQLAELDAEVAFRQRRASAEPAATTPDVAPDGGPATAAAVGTDSSMAHADTGDDSPATPAEATATAKPAARRRSSKGGRG